MEAKAPIITIDLNSPTPVYRQIAGTLRTYLVDGILQPGDKLPTIRELATDLGIHANTVALAYRLLADEGWLELKRRRGAVVRPRPTREGSTAGRDHWRRKFNELLAESLASGLDPRHALTILTELQQKVQRRVGGS